MNQQEKQIIKNIVAVFPMLDESNKKYLLGLSEGMVLVRKQENASYKGKAAKRRLYRGKGGGVMAAAVLEIVKRITGFIVGVLIGYMMDRWAYKKIWNLKKPSRMKKISIRFLQWVIVLLLIFLFLVAVDLLGYVAITYLPVF